MRIDWSKLTLAQALVVVGVLGMLVAFVLWGGLDPKTAVAVVGAWLAPSMLPLSPASPQAPTAGEVAK